MAQGDAVRASVMVVLGFFASFAAVVAYRQGVTNAIQAISPEGDVEQVESLERACVLGCDVRALMSEAAARAVRARRSSGAARSRQLGRAEIALKHALKVEPRNGGAWIELAYVQALQDAGPSARVLKSLSRSYQAEPFSPVGAPWRIGFTGSVWPLLGADLREAALSEAVWRWGVARKERPAIEAAFAFPTARQALVPRLEDRDVATYVPRAPSNRPEGEFSDAGAGQR